MSVPAPRRAHSTRRSARVRAALRRAAIFVISRGLNPLSLVQARRPSERRLAIVEHRGRRSGRVYRTPVQARRTPDGGFVIPLTWGAGTDWFQNVQAANGCVLYWHGLEYALTAPQIIGGPWARSGFQPLERAILRLVGVRFAYLRPRLDAGRGREEEPLRSRRSASDQYTGRWHGIQSRRDPLGEPHQY